MANEEAKIIAKWGNQLKKLRFTVPQQVLLAQILNDSSKNMESLYMEKTYMLFMGLMGNVLIGNNYLDKKTVRDAFQECFELFGEIDQETLDWGDVIKYNEENAGVEISLDHYSDLSVDGKDFCKIKDIVPIKERVKNIMVARDNDLKSLEEAAEHITSEETKLATRCYRGEYDLILKALKEGGIL